LKPDLAEQRGRNLRQLVLKASRALNDRISIQLRQAGFVSVTNAQVFLLSHIATEGSTITDIAKRMGTSKQAASKTVADLVAMGFVAVGPDVDDRRQVQVTFSPAGRELMGVSFDIMADIEADFSRQFGASRWSWFKEGLELIGAPSEGAS
jgi:DNA-binding MarR family transcriptional regulator